MRTRLYPLLFHPVYKDYLWGGDRIIHKYGRNEPPGIYAESWEVTERDDGMSVVANGALAGSTLRELIGTYGNDLLGTKAPPDRFPLLIKLIDSRQSLSVQVHPDDESAARYGGEAKTEMWYVLDADPSARVYAGLKPGVGEHEFTRAIQDKSFANILRAVPVRSGDVIFIPGGRVHAIDKGCLLLEVQQNSNTTYRIYDWDRVGADGRPRPLHVKEALRVIHWDDAGDPKPDPESLPCEPPNTRASLLRTEYFVFERLGLRAPWGVSPNLESFQVLFVAEGSMSLHWDEGELSLVAGQTVMIPASLPGCELVPGDAGADLLMIRLP